MKSKHGIVKIWNQKWHCKDKTVMRQSYLYSGNPSNGDFCIEMGACGLFFTKELNTLRPRRNWQHLADDIFKRIFFNENVRISINNSLKFVPKGPINNIPALVQIMAWRRPGDKPLSEPMVVSLTTHICVTRPQWVKPSLANCHWNLMTV